MGVTICAGFGEPEVVLAVASKQPMVVGLRDLQAGAGSMPGLKGLPTLGSGKKSTRAGGGKFKKRKK